MRGLTDRKASWLLGVLGGLLAVVLVLDRGGGAGSQPAWALENPTVDRKEMIEELKRVNERLDRLIGLFESGKVKVVVSNAEEIRGVPAAPAAEKGREEDESRIIIRRKAE